MPRCRSYFKVLAEGGSLSASQHARLARDSAFRQKSEEVFTFGGVPAALHQPLNKMVEGRILHQMLVDSTGIAKPSGKASAHLALKQGTLNRSDYHSIRSRMENADEGKHNVVPQKR